MKAQNLYCSERADGVWIIADHNLRRVAECRPGASVVVAIVVGWQQRALNREGYL